MPRQKILLLDGRLAPDMRPMTYQVQSACYYVKAAAGRPRPTSQTYIAEQSGRTLREGTKIDSSGSKSSRDAAVIGVRARSSPHRAAQQPATSGALAKSTPSFGFHAFYASDPAGGSGGRSGARRRAHGCTFHQYAIELRQIEVAVLGELLAVPPESMRVVTTGGSSRQDFLH